MTSTVGNITFTGGSPGNTFAQIGHGGSESQGNNGDYLNTGDVDKISDITVTSAGGIDFKGGSSTNAFVQIGDLDVVVRSFRQILPQGPIFPQLSHGFVGLDNRYQSIVGANGDADIATLTGACVVALGQYMAGLMGNDDAVIEQLKEAAKASGEKVWHLPCTDEYSEDMKSGVADISNIGKNRWGGAITAGAFLKAFVGDTKWAHIDMAGMDMSSSKKHSGEGSPGYGVRLLTEFAINYK